jgi:integrase
VSEKREPGVGRDDKRRTWYYWLDVPAADGHRGREHRRGFPTMTAANAAIRERRRGIADGVVVAPSDETVRGFARRWCDELLPLSGVSPSTIDHYRCAVRPFVEDNGDRLVHDVTAAECDSTYARRLRDGRAPRTVRATHVALRAMFREARRLGLIGVNPTDRAKPPSASASRAPEPAVWDAGQLGRFLEHVADHDWAALWHLAAMTGCRRAELAGLRWSDVDLDAGLLHVRRGRSETSDGAIHEGRPKTERARRSVELDPRTVAVLRSHRKAMLERQVLLGKGWRGGTDPYVFVGLTGEPIRPATITKAWRRLVERASRELGIPRIGFHGLRHTHATILVAASRDPSVASRRLGHASEGFTLAVYRHVLPGEERAAVEAAADAVYGSSP